jgi:hypothetical protein
MTINLCKLSKLTRSTRQSAMYDEKPNLSKGEWISVLKLSTKWLFNDLRKLAISQLSSLSIPAIDLICLAKEYRVYDWLLKGYERVVSRLVSQSFSGVPPNAPLSSQEGRKIGMEVALMLSGIAIRQLRSGGDNIPLAIRRNDILEKFKEEFDSIQREERHFMTRANRDAEAEEKVVEETRLKGTTSCEGKERTQKKKRKTAKQLLGTVKEEKGEVTSVAKDDEKPLTQEAKGSQEAHEGHLDKEKLKQEGEENEDEGSEQEIVEGTAEEIKPRRRNSFAEGSSASGTKTPPAKTPELVIDLEQARSKLQSWFA